jgi:hypothetical protein
MAVSAVCYPSGKYDGVVQAAGDCSLVSVSVEKSIGPPSHSKQANTLLVEDVKAPLDSAGCVTFALADGCDNNTTKHWIK